MIRLILVVVFLTASIHSAHAWDGWSLTIQQEQAWNAARDAGNICVPEPDDPFCRWDFTREAVPRYEQGTGFDRACCTMNYIEGNSRQNAILGFSSHSERWSAMDGYREEYKAYLRRWGIE